jgi:steroid delta-isomerase-like uncharacterized protein
MIKPKNKDIFYNWLAATNMHDIDKVLCLLDEEIEINSSMFGHWTGKRNSKELLCKIYHAFPNLFLNPITVTTNEDRVAAEIDFEGKHLGKFNGNPALGNKFLMRGAFIFDLNKSDKIIGIRSYYDSRLMNRQLEIMKI